MAARPLRPNTHLGTVLSCALVSAGVMSPGYSQWQLLIDTFSSSSPHPTPPPFSLEIPLKWHTPRSLVCFWGDPN